MATHLPYFLASFTWNYGLGMTWLVVPLYAYSKGLSGAEIGILFSAPSIAQLAINLVGGAYVDRLGGKRMVLALRAVGGIGAGLLVARFVNTGPGNPWPVIGGVLVAMAVGLQPLVSHWMLGAMALATTLLIAFTRSSFQIRE